MVFRVDKSTLSRHGKLAIAAMTPASNNNVYVMRLPLVATVQANYMRDLIFLQSIASTILLNISHGYGLEFYVNENTFKERLQLYFVKNQRSSLRIRILNLFLKLVTCLLYVLRVMIDDEPTNAACYECAVSDKSLVHQANNLTEEQFSEKPYIHWDAIVWIDRPFILWAIQLGISFISLSQALLLLYLGYKGNIWQQIMSFHFILEMVNTIPFIATLAYPPLRNLFIPVFLNCWLAKHALENMFNDLHRAMQRSQSALSQQLMILSATLLCLVFTSVCGFQHFQRAGHKHLNLFQAFYFVVVTLATVGYGDFVPDIWPSQLFMVIMICVALIVLPTQLHDGNILQNHINDLSATVCGFQHCQRAGRRHMTLFQSLYFVIVTFSTVGFGDLVPDIWPAQLYMLIMICIALIVLPTKFEQLAYTWMERQKLGGTYSSHRAHNEKHVVVCSTTLHADTIMDFLNEFYAHPLLQDYYVVLLSPCELDLTMRMILQIPMWAQRVIYIQGSCLRDTDLTRARMSEAEACFILAARNYADKTAADEHTILRSWAVKDFAPSIPQYVQIFRPENKVHVKFAEYCVCEDEFKYALLANNCLCPGTSTLVTLLLHTSRGQEGQTSQEEWHRLYGKCSGNEIYHIRLADSRFFGEYENKSFTYASFHSHRKYGVALVAVWPTDVPNSTILLNPGPQHMMKKTDICFYLNITKEENSAFILANPNGDVDKVRQPTDVKQSTPILTVAIEPAETGVTEHNPTDKWSTKNHLQVPSADGGLKPPLGRRPSIAPVPAMLGSSLNLSESTDDTLEDEIIDDGPWETACERSKIIKGFPPVTPYIGTSPTLCYLLEERKPICCLQLAQVCEHCTWKNAKEYNWPNRAIILAADYASNGIYNFIVPLRAHFHHHATLNPVILLLEQPPDDAFLDSISWFPLVYWMQGYIDCLDDLLKAGINLADNVVVVNKESSNSAEEDYLADCNTIVAVQTMFKLFPSIKIITELSQSSNMRFMQFRARDAYALHLSKMEKTEKERGSHISYMFRLPFAAGSVFSASMLDTLLYQAFVKDYLITFVRLLLGIDQAPGSGFLTSLKLTKQDLWIRTYGRLYQKLCSTTCETPIAIFRIQSTEESTQLSFNREDDVDSHTQSVERQEISNLVKCRMRYLGLPIADYDDVSEKRNSLSYVIINPSCDLKLEEGDVIFLIRPSPFNSQKSFERHPSFRRKTLQRNSSSRRFSLQNKMNNSGDNMDDRSSNRSEEFATGVAVENGSIRITVNGSTNTPEVTPTCDEREGTMVVKIEYFVYEKTCKYRLKRFFFKNKTTSLAVLIILFFLKLTTCFLYVIRVVNDLDPHTANCYECTEPHEDVVNTASPFYGIKWWALIWVDRPLWMWAAQVGIAIFTLTITLLMTILRYKGNVWELLTGKLYLELLTTIPFIITLSCTTLINLFIPVFINVWIAKQYLGTIFNFGKSQSLLAQQVVSVVSLLVCLVYTAMCCFQHAERAGAAHGNVTIFSSFYFIMVTLSSVGYGDLTPTIWISRILVVLVIFTALGVLPKQFEKLASTWFERQRLGGSYTKSKRGKIDKHVVLCLPKLNPETLMDFLTEFFAHRRLQNYTVVILTQDDLQPAVNYIIHRNTWTNKVKYIKGSCLRDIDLKRARIEDADGCFILSVDSSFSKTIADELTIMNAWAIKDFAPHVRQFVRIYRPEHEVYVDFASSVVCEDEFKYAMLAYNCICPATSTLITLLLHTSRGEEGNQCTEKWIRLYGKCSGNEIYTTDVKTSVIFNEYVGKSFPEASLNAHRKYGVTLIAVKRTDDPEDDHIKLNPGPSHLIREADKCYYLSITREQNMNFTTIKTSSISSALSKQIVSFSDSLTSSLNVDDDKIPKEIIMKRLNGMKKNKDKFGQFVGNGFESMQSRIEKDTSYDWIAEIEKTEIVCGFPPVTPYIGTNPTACHLLQNKKKICCMRLDQSCEHIPFLNAKEYNWVNRPIILISMEANNGIYHFVLPLRAHVLSRKSLKPIIIMVEKEPSAAFADSLSWFPLVYWLKGSIQSLDDLLRAGIDVAGNIVVTNRDNFNEDDEISDTDTVLTVQKLIKFFPNTKITTELSSTTMMRFLHFQPGNPFAQYLSVIEKAQEIEKGSHVSFMFRLQFASGNVFSASMIHTLLYQAILKDFVIPLTRLMLGIDQTPGSGFLTGLTVKSSDLLTRGTYGKMFNYLCASSGSIPIAIYRTHTGDGAGKFAVEITDSKLQSTKRLEEQEIEDIVKHRMNSLGFKRDSCDLGQPTKKEIMYVIINPHSSLPLEEGDFLLSKTASFYAQKKQAQQPYVLLEPQVICEGV
uniref:RCK N-terminal domain-containing protein n=1 Tax=Strigamia maritima TaxID=126957 RepID=T1J7B9_STRMM